MRSVVPGSAGFDTAYQRNDEVLADLSKAERKEVVRLLQIVSGHRPED